MLQIHPTLRCNLRCLHCYSSSGPDRREELSPELLKDALSDACDEGYRVVSVSGGEPVLYRPLPELLAHARANGMRTTVTSNGMLLSERWLARVRDVLDLLAISLDGIPASHNRMRDSARAFPTMAARLDGVRRSGIPFGFIFTLTQHNVDELDWVAGFALEQGAGLLQIHPLEEAGRARRLLAGSRPDHVETTYAYLEALRIQAVAGERLRVQLDVVDRELLTGGESITETGVRRRPLSTVVSPLVVEADGAVVPLEYGFLRAYALGNLHDGRLRELASSWKRERSGAFQELCRRALAELHKPAALPFANWYEVMADLGAVV